MEDILKILEANYIWVIVVGIFILFTIIGFFVDRNQNKKRKAKTTKIEEKDEEKVLEQPEKINVIEEQEETDEEMSNTFLKEKNYDLNSLISNEEKNESTDEYRSEATNEYTNETTAEIKMPQITESETPSVEPMQNEQEKPEEETYDRNLEYLLKDQEQPSEEIESIDDFLQRTMREAYHPTVDDKEESNEQEEQQKSSEIDYEDTLPIPVQKEDFSPVEVTVVDPEFYKENTIEEPKEEKKEMDFKPIEDAILESLGKLSETEEKNEE